MEVHASPAGRVGARPSHRINSSLGGAIEVREVLSRDLFKMLCVYPGGPAPDSSRQCFLKCGHQSLADHETVLWVAGTTFKTMNRIVWS